MAAKVHPNSGAEPAAVAARSSPAVLTVWRKSLLFNCDGFTVFDAKGDLAFRVDCYGKRRAGAEVVLMDAAGRPLLTVRRKRLLSLAERWLIYDIDSSRPLLSLRRSSSSSAKALAYVVTSNSDNKADETSYVVEGSYGRRACAVRDANGDAVAEVRRKDSVGDDVFRLVADPRLGAPMSMGLVIALDDMFRGGRSRASFSSSSSLARSLLRRTWSKSFWSPWMTTTRSSLSPSTQQ